MLYRKALITAFFIVSILNAHSQDVKDKIPPNIKVPGSVDVNNVNPADITPENLRKIGATEQQIKEALDYKRQMEGDNTSRSDNSQSIDNTESNQFDSEVEVKNAEKEQEIEEVLEDQENAKENLSVGEAIDIYGQSFFRDNNLQIYEKASSIKAPDNYIIGAGDELNIAIWGYSDFNEVFTINEFGSIHSKLVGRIYLKGLSFKAAKSLIAYRFGQVYDLQNSKIEVILIYSRIISINIVGEVFKPGTYKLPALNTAFNALVAVGGSNNIGSLRKIYIKRGGKIIRTLDVYKFLLEPETDQDFFLENNDYIFVPTRGKTVRINGKVNRPHNYELLDKENLMDLIDYAGGLKASAFRENIQVKRFNANIEEILIDVNLDSLIKNKKDFKLLDGDEILIRRLPEGIINTVEVRGAVKIPGIYEFKQDITLKDLISRAEGLRIDAFMEEAFLIRIKEDLSTQYIKIDLSKVINDTGSTYNIPLVNFDQLEVLSKADFVSREGVSIKGAVRNPRAMLFGDGITLRQLILSAGGLKENAYLERAYIIRKNNDLSIEYIAVKLDTINHLEMLDKIVLKKRDLVQVFSQGYFNDKYSVSVTGFVRNPGKYSYDKDMTLADVLIFSGGFKKEAANNRIEISRITNFDESIQEALPTKMEVITVNVTHDVEKDNVAKNIKLQPYDQIFVRKTPEFELQRNVTLTGEVKYPGVYSLQDKNEKLVSVINRAGGLTDWAFSKGATLYRKQNNIGNIVMRLDKSIKRTKSKTNYILKVGDVIHVPTMIDFVHISGAIDYPRTNFINAPYHKGKRARFYIRKYGGGFDKEARQRSTYVLHANGIKRNTMHFGIFKVYPRIKKGSGIFALYKPEKKKKEKNDKESVDWNDVIENATIKLTGLLTLLILMNSLK